MSGEKNEAERHEKDKKTLVRQAENAYFLLFLTREERGDDKDKLKRGRPTRGL